MIEDHTRSKLNRLYWESDESVADIADRLDLSRRGLYDALEPRSAGVSCPACRQPLVFRNRTALEAGEAECLECGRTLDLADAFDEDPLAEQEERAASLAPLRRSVPGDAPVLAVVLLLGLAVGAVLAYLIRRG